MSTLPPKSKDKAPGVIPRWEWRIFGQDLTTAESWLSSQQSTGVQETDEVYFLSKAGGIVKIRHDLLDIKLLRETDPFGLERWEPVMKAGFPLSATDLQSVLEALHLDLPSRTRPAWSEAAFREDFAGTSGPLRAVRVHKRRVRYAISNCMVELSDVTAELLATRTMAAESEDPAAVVSLVRTMGLEGWTNTNYPRGLTALIDAEPERYAVLDVGTNSVKFHIGRRNHDGTWTRVADRAELTRLGEGQNETGVIGEAALNRTTAAMRAMVDEAKSIGVRALAAVGTAGLRLARNREAVRSAMREATGTSVQVISGEEEARLAYLAVVAHLGVAAGSVAVFDTGGGSSQFTFGRGTRVDQRFSLDVGAVRYTERFGLDQAVTPEVIRSVMAALSTDLGRLDESPKVDALVGMGGAVTNMAAVMHRLASYDPDVVQGTLIHRSEIDRQIELYSSQDAQGRRSIVGLQPKRADVILAGACIVRSIMNKLDAKTLTVSDRGLRHGVLLERFGSGAHVGRRPKTQSPAQRKTEMNAIVTADSTRLNEVQLSEAVDLLEGVDSVELKLTVPVTEHRATIAALPIDPVEAEPRQVFFFDTPDLQLNQAGVVVRARRIQGGGADTVVKLRPVVPAELPLSIRQSGSFKVEIDFLPGGFVCSGSMKGKSTGAQVRDVAAGTTPLNKLLSSEQRAFYRKHAPEGLTLNSLSTLGPIFLLKMLFWPKSLGRKVVAEFWLYPDGSRVLEISTKCKPEETFKVGAQLRAYAAKRGITIESGQQTKTKSALEFYARELQAVVV